MPRAGRLSRVTLRFTRATGRDPGFTAATTIYVTGVTALPAPRWKRRRRCHTIVTELVATFPQSNRQPTRQPDADIDCDGRVASTGERRGLDPRRGVAK